MSSQIDPPIVVEETPVEAILDRLPAMVARLSVGRAQIAIDQIRAALQHQVPQKKSLENEPIGPLSKQQCPLVWLTTSLRDGSNPNEATSRLHSGDVKNYASLIAIQDCSGNHRVGEPPAFRNSATVLHAFCVSDHQANDSLLRRLCQEFDQRMKERGVRFLQWATDPIDDNRHHLAANRFNHEICRVFNFEKLATLRYLTVELPPQQKQTNLGLRLRAVDLDHPQDFDQFAEMVSRTYQETHDCPRLNEFRTTAETLAGYQAVASFRKHRWYLVFPKENSESPVEIMTERPDATKQNAIGVIIMAGHSMAGHSAPPSDSAAPSGSAQRVNTDHSSELVYMALVPEARGQGLGRALFRAVVNEAIEAGSKQLLLAVDEDNLSGRAIYESTDGQRAPMQVVLRETVWGKRI